MPDNEKKTNSILLIIMGFLLFLFTALSLLPRRCPFARLIYSVGDLPARCEVVVEP